MPITINLSAEKSDAVHNRADAILESVGPNETLDVLLSALLLAYQAVAQAYPTSMAAAGAAAVDLGLALTAAAPSTQHTSTSHH